MLPLSEEPNGNFVNVLESAISSSFGAAGNTQSQPAKGENCLCWPENFEQNWLRSQILETFNLLFTDRDAF